MKCYVCYRNDNHEPCDRIAGQDQIEQADMDTVENHIKDTAQYRCGAANVVQADDAEGESIDQRVGKPVQHLGGEEQG